MSHLDATLTHCKPSNFEWWSPSSLSDHQFGYCFQV